MRKLRLGDVTDLQKFTKLVSVQFPSQCLVYTENSFCTYQINKSNRFCVLIQADFQIHVTNHCAEY